MKSYPIFIFFFLMLFVITTCSITKQRPIELFSNYGNPRLYPSDSTEEFISYDIYCMNNSDQQIKDTLYYKFICEMSIYKYPVKEISNIYNYYFPNIKSGVLGLNISKFHLPQTMLPDSSRLPLYHYQINDSSVCFHYMGYEERVQELQHERYDWKIYHTNSKDRKWYCAQTYEFIYKYLNGRDTLFNKIPSRMIPFENLPLIYAPLDTNVYIRGQLVKKRLGYFARVPEDSINSKYLQQADTFILSLPMKLFQRAYYETRELNCLDGKILPVKWP